MPDRFDLVRRDLAATAALEYRTPEASRAALGASGLRSVIAAAPETKTAADSLVVAVIAVAAVDYYIQLRISTRQHRHGVTCGANKASRNIAGPDESICTPTHARRERERERERERKIEGER